jgi:membrane protease YdiL (CAAX protease family)
MISEEKSYLCLIFILYVIDDLIDAFMGNLDIMGNFLKSAKSIIVVAAIGIVAFVLAGLMLYDANIGNLDLGFLISYIAPMSLMLLGVVLYNKLIVKSEEPIMCSIRGLSPTIHIWGLLLLVALTIVLSPLLRLLPASDSGVPSGIWAVVTLIFLAPTFEELIFRATIFSIMRSSCRPTFAALVSSLLFAAMHGGITIGIEAFFAGMIFSYAYILTQSILAPIILHIFNNTIAYVLIQFEYQELTIQDYIGALPSFNIIYAISLLITILGLTHIVVTYRRADRLIRDGKTLRDMAHKQAAE